MADDRSELIRATVRQITKKWGRKYWVERSEAHEPLTELWDAIAEAGFLGVMVPEEYGGSGVSVRDLVTITEEFANEGISPPHYISSSVAAVAIARHGSEGQKRRYLPTLARGEERFAFSITEPDAGSNTFRIKTMARREGDDYVINGQKIWTSGIDTAENVFLVARTTAAAEVADKREGLSLFVFPANTPGITMTPIPTRMVVPDWSFQVFYDNVRVPREALVSGEGKGLRALFDGLNPERMTAAVTAIGMGRFALAKGVEYAKSRKVFNEAPIGSYQGLAHPMALAKTHLELAALMAHKAAELFDTGGDAREIGTLSNMCKLAGADAAIEAVDVAMQAHGGLGFSKESDVITVWPLVRMFKTTPVARELILSDIAEHVLGLPRSY